MHTAPWSCPNQPPHQEEGPLPQGRSSPCAQSPWCPDVSSAWRSACLERGDEQALLSQGVSGGDGALPWEGVSVSGLSFRPSSLPFSLSFQEGGFLEFGVFFFNLFIFNWRIIALQYCVGFCHPRSLLYFLTQKGTVQNKGSSEVARHCGEQEGGCSVALPLCLPPLQLHPVQTQPPFPCQRWPLIPPQRNTSIKTTTEQQTGRCREPGNGHED